MSYQTLEVGLENGQVRPRGPERLPDKARALLTIIEPAAVPSEGKVRTLGEALRELRVTGRGEYTDPSTNKEHLDDLGR